jgi:hypothetical protein
MFGVKTGRNPCNRLGAPRAIESRADLPTSIVDPDEPTVVKVDIAVSDYQVDAQPGVEAKLGAALMLVPMPMGWRVSRRPPFVDND